MKKNSEVAKPENGSAAPAAAPEAAAAKKPAIAKKPAGSGAKPTLGDISVIGAAVLLVATVALQLLSLKALFLF